MKTKTQTFKFIHSAPITIGADGKAPESLFLVYADVPYDRDGIRGIQRLDRAAAETLAGLWRALAAKDARLAAGIPMYQGHPDYTAGDDAEERDLVRNQPPAYGWITAIIPEELGIRMPITWTPAGRRMVEEREFRFYSPFFLSEPAGEENGIRIYIPRVIRSAGLTNTPNWPQAPLVNAADNKTNPGAERNEMTLLEKLGKSLGTTFDTDDAAVAAVEAANAEAKRAKTAEADAAAKKKDAETANAADKATISALRLHIATAAVNAAVARGAILKDHAAGRIADLANSGDAIATRVAEVEALPPLMKTEAGVDAAALSKRGVTTADARAAIQEAVNAKMAAGISYDAAFAAVQRDQPGLFVALEIKPVK